MANPYLTPAPLGSLETQRSQRRSLEIIGLKAKLCDPSLHSDFKLEENYQGN